MRAHSRAAAGPYRHRGAAPATPLDSFVARLALRTAAGRSRGLGGRNRWTRRHANLTVRRRPPICARHFLLVLAERLATSRSRGRRPPALDVAAPRAKEPSPPPAGAGTRRRSETGLAAARTGGDTRRATWPAATRSLPRSPTLGDGLVRGGAGTRLAPPEMAAGEAGEPLIRADATTRLAAR